MKNSTYINLKGFAIGDGCLGTESEGACGIDRTKIQLEFLFAHGQVRNFRMIPALQCGIVTW